MVGREKIWRVIELGVVQQGTRAVVVAAVRTHIGHARHGIALGRVLIGTAGIELAICGVAHVSGYVVLAQLYLHGQGQIGIGVGERGNGDPQLRAWHPSRQSYLQCDLLGSQVRSPPDAGGLGIAIDTAVAGNGLVDGLARGFKPGLTAILAVQPDLGRIGQGIDHQPQPQAMGTARSDADRRHLPTIRGLGPPQRTRQIACGLQRRQRPRRTYLHGHTGHGHDHRGRVAPLRQGHVDGLGPHGHGRHGHFFGRSRRLRGGHDQRVQHMGRGRARRGIDLCAANGRATAIAAAVTDRSASAPSTRAGARVGNTATATTATSGQQNQHQACA